MMREKTGMNSVRAALFGASLCLCLFAMGGVVAAQGASTPQAKYQAAKEQANASSVTIISSSVSSTYTRFAQDMQNVLDDRGVDGLRVLPLLGSGGGQNIQDMLSPLFDLSALGSAPDLTPPSACLSL
jgi:TRAP-type uncharacterized transport system substrate-binding protein